MFIYICIACFTITIPRYADFEIVSYDLLFDITYS